VNIRHMEFSSNIASLQPSATIAVSTLAKQLRSEGRDIIDLSAGEPDFDTPSWIAAAAIAGIESGQTRYTPVAGIPELRKAVAGYLSTVSKDEIDWEGVVVSSGAKHSLFNTAFACFGPGDEVLVTTPYWVSYPEIISLSRADSVFVSGNEKNNFLVTPEDLDTVYTDRTKGLILCSPCNPTGAVYTLDQLEALACWAKERNVVLIADEIYREIYFGSDRLYAPSVLELPKEKRGNCVLIDGASKSFAMTGWRIGFSYSDPEIAKKFASIQSHSTSNPASPSQMAALAAFGDPKRAREEVRIMNKAFVRRKNLVADLLRERLPHLSFVEPEGAFYFFIKIDSLFREGRAGSVDVCSWILQEAGVAMVPGSAFGDDRFARISFATSDDLLVQAVGRIASLLDNG
jgi:aspartate aminotransferase